LFAFVLAAFAFAIAFCFLPLALFFLRAQEQTNEGSNNNASQGSTADRANSTPPSQLASLAASASTAGARSVLAAAVALFSRRRRPSLASLYRSIVARFSISIRNCLLLK